MTEKYIYVIVALLPLSSLMLVTQTNPYHALVIRAILGAVAALVYIIFGAADVALTEALVGTMLAVTLYVIAVRSSLVMRLGIVENYSNLKQSDYFTELIENLRKVINKHHLRLELVKYSNSSALKQALLDQEVHAICNKKEYSVEPNQNLKTEIKVQQAYQTTVRVYRLFEILQKEFIDPENNLQYLTVTKTEEQH